jgi:hypothetical protein
VAFLGCAEKTRRPIVKQCHTDSHLLADKSRILRPFSPFSIWSRIEPAAFCEDLIDACMTERTSKEPMTETGSWNDIRI